MSLFKNEYCHTVILRDENHFKDLNMFLKLCNGVLSVPIICDPRPSCVPGSGIDYKLYN